MRLVKYLAHAGVASRRRAERLIADGRVEVDGAIVTDPALDVGDGNEVRADGRPVVPELLEHYVVNKPTGVVSTADDPQGRPKVVDLVESGARLYPVGRLDVDTSGLIILTNDGALANLLTHPSYEVRKTYRARVAGAVTDADIARLRKGVDLEDGRTAPADARALESGPGGSLIELTIHEGRKRQVRRMCDAIGHPVERLQRIRIGPLELGDLRPGAARPLTGNELGAVRSAGARL
ncbi:MAG: pseudouridine synthase [Solirubrobacterales bacterium]